MIRVVLWLSLLTAAVAAADPLESYTVQPGDSCVSIAKKVYGSGKRVDLIHGNNALGPSPHHLKPGQILHLPPAGGESAKLTFIRNQVEAYTPQRHAGQRDETLGQGNKVSTLSRSSAEVTFKDSSRLQLGEETLVVIFGESSAEVRKKTNTGETTLYNGSLRASLSELAGAPPRPMTVATAGGQQLSLGAGEAQVEVDAKKSTRLSVYRGRSKMRSAGTDMQVPAGFGSSAEAGKAPSKPRPLPPAPVWVTPPARLVLAEGGGADVTGAYAPGGGELPAKWHVQLARDEAFNDLLVDERPAAAVGKLEARGLTDGELRARVSAIDALGFEGSYGPVARVRVAPIKIDQLDGGKRTRIEVGAGVWCAIDDAPLEAVTAPIEIERTHPHTFRCAAEAGAASASSLPLALAAIVEPPPPVVIPPPPPPPPAPHVRKVFGEVGALGGFAVGPGRATVGGTIAFNVGLRLDGDAGSLAIELRPSFEQYAVDGTQYGWRDQVLAVGLAMSYRILNASHGWTPYLGLEPQLRAEWERFTASGPAAPRASGTADHLQLDLAAMVGVLARTGPGEVLVEVGVRYSPSSPRLIDDFQLSRVFVRLGYRFLM